ncbi:MAG: hypothetical protein LBO69_04705 [Ignavibacteria bacterium]|jgi:signal transduction histidine kinase|nr:hypothetical protein [Ignavibacteria bacterium]
MKKKNNDNNIIEKTDIAINSVIEEPIDDMFDSKDNYIQTLELSVQILQNELRDAITRLANADNDDADESVGLQMPLPIFSKYDSIQNIFETLYQFLQIHCSIKELDYFDISDSDNVRKIDGIGASVNLENVFKDLEERGLLQWTATSNEVKIIPNLEDGAEQIKSLLIIPIVIRQTNVGFFIANTQLRPDDVNPALLNAVLVVAQNAYLQIDMIKNDAANKNASTEHNILINQILSASNQIAISELLVTLNEAFELPMKVMKTNIDLIQKGVGDTKRRVEILIEQFTKLINSHKLMQHFGAFKESQPTNHPFSEIFTKTMEVVASHLSKYGVTLETNYYDATEIKNEMVKCSIVQLIFAISNIILHSLSSMPDGGKINIGVFKNDDAKRISIIITDNGIGTEDATLATNLVILSDLSEKKVKDRFLFFISQQIILQHLGKFSLYSDEGKGTTYKISLPISKI